MRNLVQKTKYFSISKQFITHLDADQDIFISGVVRFPGAPANLPINSCAHIALRDVSIMDVAAFTIASTHIDVSGKNLNEGMTYKLTSKKPADSELWRTYSLSVTINIGWCKNQNSNNSEWIRSGDYFTASQNNVAILNSKNSFDSDITLNCYGEFLCHFDQTVSLSYHVTLMLNKCANSHFIMD